MKTLFFIQSLLILVNIFDISWYLVGLEEISKIIFRNLISRLITTIAIFNLINHASHLNLYALINVVGMLTGNLSMIYYIKKNITLRNFTFKIHLKHIRGAFKLFIPTVLISSYQPIENSILRFSFSATSVGIYDQGMKIINLLFAVINSGFNALSPRMSYYVGNKETDQVKELFNKTLVVCSIFSIIVISGTIIVAEDFVAFFFGPGYESTAPVLSLLSLSLVVMPIFTLINQGILIPNGRDKEYTYSYIIMITTGIIFNLILSSRFGSIGAAISYNFAALFSFLYLIRITFLEINTLLIFKNIFLIILSVMVNVVVMTAFSPLFTFNNFFFSFLIKGFISVLLNLFQISIFFIANKIFNRTVLNIEK